MSYRVALRADSRKTSVAQQPATRSASLSRPTTLWRSPQLGQRPRLSGSLPALCTAQLCTKTRHLARFEKSTSCLRDRSIRANSHLQHIEIYSPLKGSRVKPDKRIPLAYVTQTRVSCNAVQLLIVSPRETGKTGCFQATLCQGCCHSIAMKDVQL